MIGTFVSCRDHRLLERILHRVRVGHAIDVLCPEANGVGDPSLGARADAEPEAMTDATWVWYGRSEPISRRRMVVS